MKNKLSKEMSWFLASLGGLVLVGSIGYTIYNLNLIDKENSKIISDLTSELEKTIATNHSLVEQTKYKQTIIDSFQGQISNIGSTVGTLEKLSQTDKELLRKYSKVYFLSENYVPAKLTEIDKQYVFNGSTNFLIHAEVWPFLDKLLKATRTNNLDLVVASAFRSFDTQESLKSEYKVIYGSGTANQFSADQGYSEHQLGTSVDFTTSKVGGVSSNFASDPVYQWLKDYAYMYGFVLSYPEKNAYYKFEPWHWRFVGVALAETLHRENKYFYDLDQREIDAYLIKLFD